MFVPLPIAAFCIYLNSKTNKIYHSECFKGLCLLVKKPSSVLEKIMFASRGTQSNLDTSRGRKTGLELVNINKTLKIARCF